jgi:hypothetical protein
MVCVVPTASVSYASSGNTPSDGRFCARSRQERICIGSRFKNDTERLEKLFELCTKMTATKATGAA